MIELLAALPEVDFGTINGGNWSASSPYHTGYSRLAICSTDQNGGVGYVSKMWTKGTKTTFGATFRVVAVPYNWNRGTEPSKFLFMFLDSGGSPRLGLYLDADTHLCLVKYNGSSVTVLEDTGKTPDNARARFDIFVQNYGASATVEVWLSYGGNYERWINYSGDVSIGGCSGADGFAIYNPLVNAYWENVAAFDGNTVRCDTVTLVPNGDGYKKDFDAGDYTYIDGWTVDINVHADSGTVGQELIVNLSNLPADIGAARIVGVETCVVGSRGTSGPQTLQIGLRSGSTTVYETAASLNETPTALTKVYDVNPVTDPDEFTTTEIDALQLAMKSAT